MKETNFKCNECGHEMYYPQYSTYMNLGKPQYRVKNKVINCPVCSSSDIFCVKSNKGFCTNIGKFKMASPEDKKKILAKRSQEHFDKKIKERANYIDKKLEGRL